MRVAIGVYAAWVLYSALGTDLVDRVSLGMCWNYDNCVGPRAFAVGVVLPVVFGWAIYELTRQRDAPQ
jgi:hypothetical protein